MSPEEAYEIEINKIMTTGNDILVALSEERERTRELALAEGDAKAVK